MANMQDFLATKLGDARCLAGDALHARQNGILYPPNASAIKVEQMVRVGSPEPSAIMRRRQRAGTGGVGNK